MGFATTAIHTGSEPDEATGSVTVPIYQTSTYAQESIGKNKGFEYARTQNPTRTAVERNIAALEGARFGFAPHGLSHGAAMRRCPLRSLQSDERDTFVAGSCQKTRLERPKEKPRGAGPLSITEAIAITCSAVPACRSGRLAVRPVRASASAGRDSADPGCLAVRLGRLADSAGRLDSDYSGSRKSPR